MFQFFERGGIFMIPLIVCSLVAVALILERGFTLMRRRVVSQRLASVIDQLQVDHVGRVRNVQFRRISAK